MKIECRIILTSIRYVHNSTEKTIKYIQMYLYASTCVYTSKMKSVKTLSVFVDTDKRPILSLRVDSKKISRRLRGRNRKYRKMKTVYLQSAKLCYM